MSKQLQSQAVYSKEMQAILNRHPKWIINTNMLVLIAIMLILLGGTCFIRYPDTIVATAVIRPFSKNGDGTMTPPIALTLHVVIPAKSISQFRNGQLTRARLTGYTGTAGEWFEVKAEIPAPKKQEGQSGAYLELLKVDQRNIIAEIKGQQAIIQTGIEIETTERSLFQRIKEQVFKIT